MNDDKNRHPEEQAAHYLANLLGTSVAGFHPSPGENYDGSRGLPSEDQLPSLDLDIELFRKNIPVSGMIILSALVKGSKPQRDQILARVKRQFFTPRDFLGYLFEIVLKQIREHDHVMVEDIQSQIPEYGRIVFGKPDNKRGISSGLFKWAQILHIDPTPAQVERAIQLRQVYAEREGLLSDV